MNCVSLQQPQIVILLMDLGRVNCKSSGKDSPFYMPLRKFVIPGKRSHSKHEGFWKRFMLTLMDDCKGLKTSVDRVTAEAVERARELELEVEAEDVTELLQTHDKTFRDDKLLLVDE